MIAYIILIEIYSHMNFNFLSQNNFIYVVVQFYPWFKYIFFLFQTHYHILPYPKTNENKI